MTLRGQISDFPIETVLQLLASTGKTGQLEVRGEGQSGSLGFDGGRLVSATAGDDVGENALGAVFTVAQGDFEFIPWSDAPAANLSGDLDQLLDRAVVERNKIIGFREIVPHDALRFRLSERAAERGDVTLSADQWRALLAVNGERDVRAIADHLKVGRLVALDTLAGLVTAGFVDTVEATEAPAMPAPEAAHEPVAAEPAAWSTPAEPAEPATWSTPAAPAGPAEPEPRPDALLSATPVDTASEWERPAAPDPRDEWSRPSPEEAAPPVNEWAPPRSEPDLRSDLAAALDARMSAAAERAPAEEPLSATPLEVAPEQATANDARLAALTGIFDAPATPVPAPPTPVDRIDKWRRAAAPAEVA